MDCKGDGKEQSGGREGWTLRGWERAARRKGRMDSKGDGKEQQGGREGWTVKGMGQNSKEEGKDGR